jgi:predicted RecA/RadA family phage recombinase
MLNYEQKGDVLTLVAPGGGVTSGSPVLIHDLLVVPMATVAATKKFSGAVVGVFEFAKATGQTFDAGDKMFWDNSAEKMTADSSKLLVGVVVEAGASGDTKISGRLDGVAR